MWVGPEIEAHDNGARLFLSQYLTKCPVMLSRLSIERRGGQDIVVYTSEKETREFTPLDFLAELSAHIPDVYEQTIRYYGVYSARTRGKEREKDGEAKTFISLSDIEPPSKKAVSRSWARLIKKVYEVDPLICPKCGSTMKIKAFITEPKEVARLMENLKLPNFHPPPPLLSAEKSDPSYWDAA